uniref:Sigma-54 interaction domain-containing protein n=1 Tax=Candidatus Kentrum sp. DK TaxID=2126562 RepID=A0A450S2F0_9GAMM|nr:MAG: Sigma-54 interaction domain-containing protein [Candidatus Kentron sp. DK]
MDTRQQKNLYALPSRGEATPPETDNKPYFQWLLGPRRYPAFLSRVETIARQQGPVLITGESGSGKSTIAELLHRKSDRAPGPLSRWGCGEFQPEFADAALFGHTAQAFTGAKSELRGLLASAHGGTVILDDIDYLPLPVQGKLLRFLDSGSFRQLGRVDREEASDVRIIATTNKDLAALVREGRFLPDLLFRIRRWWLHLPPLRDSGEGVGHLAQHLLANIDRRAHDIGEAGWHFDEDALTVFSLMHLPGNFREIEDLVEVVAAFAEGDRLPITAEQLVDAITNNVYGGREVIGITRDMNRDDAIERFLKLTGRRAHLTAKIVGCAPNTVYKVGRERGLLPGG